MDQEEKMAKDSKMYYIDDDIKKIQIKTNLFIQEYGKAGAGFAEQ